MNQISDRTYFFGDKAKLFSRQVLKRKHISPVKVAISIQRAVVHICLLLILLHSWHPTKKSK